jgi:hypothetical protein
MMSIAAEINPSLTGTDREERKEPGGTDERHGKDCFHIRGSEG